MSNGLLTEDLESILEDTEDYEDYEDYESDEAVSTRRPPRRFPSPRPPRTAPGRGLVPPRPQPTGQYVSRTEFNNALNRVGEQIKTNSEAIKKVSSGVAAVSAEQGRQSDMLKKEMASRKKETDTLRRDLRQTRELAAILPLLDTPNSMTLTEDAGGLKAGTKVYVDSGNSLNLILPLLLLGGGTFGGGSSDTSSSDGGMGMDSTMLLVLALALGNK